MYLVFGFQIHVPIRPITRLKVLCVKNFCAFKCLIIIPRYPFGIVNKMVSTCPKLVNLGMTVAMQANSTRSKLAPTISRVAKFNPICIYWITVQENVEMFIKNLV